jgi:hypothetical protein
LRFGAGRSRREPWVVNVRAFGFFALLGLFAPGDVIWLTIAMAVLTAAVIVHALLVRHELAEGRKNEVARSINALRERRGF